MCLVGCHEPLTPFHGTFNGTKLIIDSKDAIWSLFRTPTTAEDHLFVRMEKGLLPGDAVAGAHAHHLLDLRFRVIEKVLNLDASGIRVPFKDIGKEAQTGFAIRAPGSIHDRSSLAPFSRHIRFRGGGRLSGSPCPFVLPVEILAIGKAGSQLIGPSVASLPPAQAAPRFAA